MSVIDPEAKRKGYETAAKVACVAVCIGLLGPVFTWLAAGMLGLIELTGYVVGFGIALVVGWGLAPGVGLWWANKRIALLKAAIAANPIETMQNIDAEKKLELQAQSKAITTVDTQYRNVQTLIDNLPAKLKAKAGSYQVIADKLKVGLDQMRKSYDFAAHKLADYEDQIAEAQSLWEVACAVNTAIAVSAKAKADVFRDIKEKVSFDTVTSTLNNAFANLDEVIRTNQTITDLGSTSDVETSSKVVVTDITPKALTEGSAADVIDLQSVRGKVVSFHG